MSAISFSQINSHRVCPKQYEAKYITKEVKFESTEATRWGIEVHGALEVRLRDKTPLPETMTQYEGDAQLLESLLGVLTAEHKLSVDNQGEICEWWDDTCLKRGIIDVLIRDGDKATIWDWKSGKARQGQYVHYYEYKLPVKTLGVKPDTFIKQRIELEELDFFAMLAFETYPELEKIKTVYRWLKLDAPPTVNIITRDQLPIITEGFDKDIEAIENAKVFDVFPAKRGGLCRQWCQVRSCRFCGA